MTNSSFTTAGRMPRRSFCMGAAVGIALVPSMVAAQDVFDVLTPEEVADYKRLGAAPTTRTMSMVASEGPKIRVASPNGFSLTSPVDFDVSIEPRDGVAVSMNTLRIHYRIGPVWKDVTNRIARHGRISGTRLQAKGANLPSGRHTLRVTVADIQSRETVAIVKFAVA